MSQHRALELLRQAAAALERGDAQSTQASSLASTTAPLSSTANRTASTAPLATSRITSAVRSIFQPYRPRSGVTGRRNTSVGHSYWTHKFIVLGRTSDVSRSC